MSAETASLFTFDNSYARLPETFFARVAPTPVRAPGLIKLNHALARELGVDPDALTADGWAAIFAGNTVPPGADPLAMAYAGHQFGSFVPQLGDGRAILLGEVIGRDRQRRDIHLKGAGQTPFSRRGDGRAALGPVLREYVVSEAMHALGIPTTRTLAAVTTGEGVMRETPLPGAVLARVAASHIRVGTFQFFSARRDMDGLQALAEHVIDRHDPAARQADNPARALLDGVIARQAGLIARWLLVGFIHGVMNTDNMTVSGETIDYGPCAFMDTYHPQTVYSSIDARGRYAYQNQPAIAQWNLVRLAETLLPLLGEDEDSAVKEAQEALDGFGGHFQKAYGAGFARKLGFLVPRSGDETLAQELLAAMDAGNADFTLTFRALCNAAGDAGEDAGVAKLFDEPAAFAAWAVRWRERLAEEGGDVAQRSDMMRAANPAFIPRNHLVAEVIAAAEERDDFAPFEKLLAVLAKPFDDQPGNERYTLPPQPHEVVHQTFCGT